MVENLAVVETLRVRFHSGLNLLTGETGSGKSLVVDCVDLLFGGRASAEMIRTDAERARVAGIFEVTPGAQRVLDEAGIEADDGEILLEREILRNGKSRAFAASRPVTATLLKDLAPHLGEIHGQHEQQRLFTPETQREILDDYAGAAPLLEQVGSLYRRWRGCTEQLEQLDRSEQEKLRMVDLWTFQRNEIEAVAPRPGEDSQLEAERTILRNLARLEENATAAYNALYDNEQSAFAALRIALRRLDELARFDNKLDAVREGLQAASIAMDDAAHAIRDYLGHLEAEPGRLEEVESRLAALDKLKRKYGSSLDQVVAYLEETRRNLAAVETAGERRDQLLHERAALEAAYASLAAKLTALRKDAAAKLKKLVETELASLAMPKAAFHVLVETAAWSPEGTDSVRFLISANVGEEPRPLEKIASGGELSRVALALKAAAAGASRPRKDAVARTLVFDEVDAGVGGSAAEAVGRRLKKLAATHQVLCVTHLPQIAGFADHHYCVEKRETKGRTITVVMELEGEARRREIGRMLSGERITAEALKHAEQLMKMGASGDARVK